MLKISKSLDGGVIIEDLIKIGGSYDKRFVNLKKIRGKDFNPQRREKVVDYPGDFHFKLGPTEDGLYIIVYEGEEKKLNFIIEGLLKDQVVAYVQNKDILQREGFEDVNIWIFEDADIEDALDKLEYEGEKIVIK